MKQTLFPELEGKVALVTGAKAIFAPLDVTDRRRAGSSGPPFWHTTARRSSP